MGNPKIKSKINACVLDKGKDLRESIALTQKEIKEMEAKLEKEFGEDFGYEYSSYDYVDDRYLIFYIEGKRHKMGGSWDIEGEWNSLKEDITQCLGKDPTPAQWNVIERELADLVGEFADLDNEKRMLGELQDTPEDELPLYESEY